MQLADDIDGLVHISQISEERVEKVKNHLKVGDDVKARVVKIDVPNRRIGLSIKAASYDMDRVRKEAENLDNLKPGEDLLIPTASFGVHTYRLRVLTRDVAIYMHEDLFQ